MGNGSEPRFSFGLKMLDSAIRPAIIAFFAAHAPCPGGGIGRRTWFRSMRREAWRFESSLGHQDSNSEQSEEVRKTPSILVITGFFCFLRFDIPPFEPRLEIAFRNVETEAKPCPVEWSEPFPARPSEPREDLVAPIAPSRHGERKLPEPLPQSGISLIEAQRRSRKRRPSTGAGRRFSRGLR
jgi:hypothetical protein